MGTWSESNSKDSLGTVVRRNFWLKAKVKPVIQLFQYENRLAQGFIPRPRIGAYWHRSGEERLCIVRAGGGAEALTEGPCRQRLLGVRAAQPAVCLSATSQSNHQFRFREFDKEPGVLDNDNNSKW